MLNWLLDRSVVFNFDRTGFKRHARGFLASDLEVNLAGRTVLVTGANSGLGFEACRGLGELGAHVVLLCRNAARGRDACERLQQAVPSGSFELELLDVSRLADVERYVTQRAPDVVDVLINNAGVLPATREETPEGVELCFATNVLGPFALTRGLLSKLRRSDDPRVIHVSSGGMYPVALDLADWEWKTRDYAGTRAYALTKRAEVVLNELWASRESWLTSSAMHPGWADTPAVRSSLPRFHQITRAILRSPAEGADTIVWLAACARLRGESGHFWFDRQRAPSHVFPTTRSGDRHGPALWELCESLMAREKAAGQRHAAAT
ncbi:MAG: SDR family NAD(P)-dependent oxidoreductase [Polyangiaceae bacterium]|nr:SDR family NAD(P)-dependent oxidoreductase [Polyangiaceae bacterium]MCB9605330.1 SDR family NAD(P)-dependent oxidoreductase [Polyangiaceae bacterium]